MQTAVLLLVFNRPHHAAAALDSIRKVQPTRLYIHADGPRADRAGEAELVAQTRAAIAEIDWPCTVYRLYREQNMGLREGVYGAINWFFEAEPWGIIIEDDCIADPSFFVFCEQLLQKYADDPQVMHIGGSNLAQQYVEQDAASFVWSKYSLVWGWASWRRAWANMHIDLDGLEAFEQSGGINTLTSDKLAQIYMLDKFNATRKKQNNSWAYAWFYSILRHNGICIVPSRNLVQNVGIGAENATNTTSNDSKSKLQAGSIAFPIQYPADRNIEQDLEKQLFYFTQKPRYRLWLWYLKKCLISN